jgi:Domain of unknown function (DUF4249)
LRETTNIPWILFALACLCWQCKEKYVSPYKTPNVGYLVVEGFISGNAPIQYTLSRTLPLPGDSTIPKEAGASVEVEGSDNSSISLIEQGNGRYSSVDTPMLNTLIRYRLRIHTNGGEDYLSDFVPFRSTPPIDSVNWVETSGGVNLFVNTHDPANATRYYEWNYDEIWEYHSAEPSNEEYDTATNQVFVRPPSDQIYSCWHEDSSTNVILGSSIKLAQDVVYLQPLKVIPKNSVQLSVRYTTLVKQWALSDSAYNYMSILQKNTESLGTVFDAQPSELFGNIHSLTNPAEQVIGFISAGTIQQQRIWIAVEQLPDWSYSYSCPVDDFKVPLDSADLILYFRYHGDIPLYPHIPPRGAQSDGWTSNYAFCIDCRYQGGTTVKPPFWPND